MSTESELEALSTRELHHRAVGRALRHADLAFLWRLLRAIPTAEAIGGSVSESEADATKVSALIADALGSAEGPAAEALRPLYLDYLEKHPGR